MEPLRARICYAGTVLCICAQTVDASQEHVAKRRVVGNVAPQLGTVPAGSRGSRRYILRHGTGRQGCPRGPGSPFLAQPYGKRGRVHLMELRRQIYVTRYTCIATRSIHQPGVAAECDHGRNEIRPLHGDL